MSDRIAMTRRERTRVLVEGDPAVRGRLAEQVRAAYDVRWLAPPRRGLVLIQQREVARGARFYLGEVLVSEARALVAGAAGIGLIAGDRPEAAEALALIDAAWNAGVAEVAGWHAVLAEEARRLRSARARHQARLLETRVSFETMETE